MTEIKDTSEFFAREAKRIAAKSMDKYNSAEMEYDPNLYQRVIHSNNQYAPHAGETLEHFVLRAKIMLEQSTNKNVRTHIETARGRPWHTHISPLGCFMCEDNQFITVLTSALEYIQHKYPKATF